MRGWHGKQRSSVRWSSWEDWLDHSAEAWQPYYVGFVWVGIHWVSTMFLWAVIMEICKARGLWPAAGHLIWGLWLLVNICYHYYYAVNTPPGYTSDIDLQVLKDAMTFEWRWCDKCNRPKPPLCHHCSMCKKCVLQMDHHCPFTHNCVGANNYHHFFLFVFWLTLGSGYAAVAGAFQHGRRFTDRSVSVKGYHGIMLACLISGAVCCGLIMLLAWHCVVAVSGYSTLELMDRWWGPYGDNPDDWDLHHQLPHVKCTFWGYKHSSGPVKNLQRALHASGLLWWLTWLLPGDGGGRVPTSGLQPCREPYYDTTGTQVIDRASQVL